MKGDIPRHAPNALLLPLQKWKMSPDLGLRLVTKGPGTRTTRLTFAFLESLNFNFTESHPQRSSSSSFIQNKFVFIRPTSFLQGRSQSPTLSASCHIHSVFPSFFFMEKMCVLLERSRRTFAKRTPASPDSLANKTRCLSMKRKLKSKQPSLAL